MPSSPTERPRSPRQRMVYAAAQQMRRQGVARTGLRAVVAEADAPWGSLQHYFPGGKDQLIAEALEWAGRYAAAGVTSYLTTTLTTTSAPTPAGLFEHLVRPWQEELVRRDFARGCPAAAAVSDSAADHEGIRTWARDALAAWRAPITQALEQMGVEASRAQDLSALMLAALEGAIILARAERSLDPFERVLRALRPALTLEAPSN